MCAGIRDAANIAWKLAFVLAGRARPALLDSYGPERIPHVRAFLELAVQQARIIQARTEEELAERRARFASGGKNQLVIPSPGLGQGFHAGANGGVLAPQFPIGGDSRFDDLAGDGFAVVATPTVLEAVDRTTRELWRDLGLVVVPASAAAEAWLADRGAGLAILRPDRYAFGLSVDAGDAARLTGQLAAALTSTRRNDNAAAPSGA